MTDQQQGSDRRPRAGRTGGTAASRSRTRRVLQLPFVATLLAALLVAVVAGPAGASPRASLQAALTLDPGIGPPTSVARATGSGFSPGETVALSFDSTRIASATAGRNGAFGKGIRIPASAMPGDHVVGAVGVSSGLVSEAVFLVRTDWLQACFDSGRSCFDPYENVLGRSTVGKLAVAWRTTVGADGFSSPVYASGEVFVGTAGGLVGLDPATGAIIINYRTARVTTTPAVLKGFDPQPDPPGKVIFGSSDGVVHAVATTGKQLWQSSVGARPASPLAIHGVDEPADRILFGAGGALFCFDGDGKQLWATALRGGAISTPPALLSLPATPAGVVVAAGNTLHAVDLATGQIVWSRALSRSRLGAPSIGDPHIVGDPHILVGDAAGRLFSLDPSTGLVVATFAARAAIAASPAIGNPKSSDPWVLVGDAGGDIYSIDQPDDFPPPVWQAALPGPVHGAPALANGVVYAATDSPIGDPTIFALDQASGRVLFHAALPGGAAAGPIVADGRLVVATRSGDVVAYSGPDS